MFLHVTSCCPSRGSFTPTTGTVEEWGADNIPCSFLSDVPCILLPTAVGSHWGWDSHTNQETAPLVHSGNIRCLSFSLKHGNKRAVTVMGDIQPCTPRRAWGARWIRCVQRSTVCKEGTKPPHEQQLDKVGFTSIFRLIYSRGQASQRPALSHPHLAVFSAYSVTGGQGGNQKFLHNHNLKIVQGRISLST